MIDAEIGCYGNPFVQRCVTLLPCKHFSDFVAGDFEEDEDHR